ncbi:MAG: hypothetical protein LBO69_04280 [Ignavibacteria bacterium]|nr:hypothetical protein [Ignavibacteria bacterium]
MTKERMSSASKVSRVLWINLALVAMLTLSFTSCNDSDNSVTTPSGNGNKLLPKSVTATSINPANSSNPYDIYGLTHNDIIMSYITDSLHYSGRNADSLLDDYYSFRLEYLTDNDPFDLSTASYIALNNAERSSMFSDSVFSHRYLDTLCEIIDNCTSYTSESITICINSIKFLESTVLTDATSGTATKKEILKRTSIARYSLALWYDQFTDTTSDFLTYCTENEPLTDGIVTLIENAPNTKDQLWHDLWNWGWDEFAALTKLDVYEGDGASMSAALGLWREKRNEIWGQL